MPDLVRYTVDEGASRLVVRTKAGGFLGKLAHDLEIAVSPVRGAIEEDDGRFRGKLLLRASAFEVVGVLRSGSVDRGTLSKSDVKQIEERLRAEVLFGRPNVEVLVSGDRDRAEVEVTLGKTARFTASLRVRAQGSSLEVQAAPTLSLKALGVKEITGPLGAFKVLDAIDVHAALVLREAS